VSRAIIFCLADRIAGHQVGWLVSMLASNQVGLSAGKAVRQQRSWMTGRLVSQQTKKQSCQLTCFALRLEA
jgi:hypothetical protein